MIKYIGSKRQLIPQIMNAVNTHAPMAKSVIDLFSGTSRVGHALKKSGYQVFSNDHNQYAYMLAKCYIENDCESMAQDAQKVIDELNTLAGQPGYFTSVFCETARFFHPKNGARIDAMRERLAQMDLPPDLFSVVLVSLMEAADRVDSTCGIQMAYLKEWAPRALLDIKLRLPELLPRAPAGKGKAYCLEAIEAAKLLKADVIYLDPPYNQHSYRGNYHIWETLVRWDKPENYGLAVKRVDVKTHKSSFNSKVQFLPTFSQLIKTLDCKTIIVSFNNEGFVNREDMETLLKSRGKVTVEVMDYKRYVGAQIGIYNQQGKAVGTVKNLYNKEFLYIVNT